MSGTTACPGCGHGFEPRFNLTSSRYRLCDCPSCGLGFFLPLEFPGAAFYETQEGPYAAQHGEAVPLAPWHEIFFRHPPPSSGTLLDIGCGNGAFLAAARSAGYSCRGIDFDRRSVEFARRVRGLDVEAASLEDFTARCRRGGLAFELVTLFEVLEHQTAPGPFLDLVRSLLKPGGLACGSVPNRRRLRWWPLEEGEYPPHHFLWWDAASLRRALEARGFVVERLASENLHSVLERLTGRLASALRPPAAGTQPRPRPAAGSPAFRALRAARNALVRPALRAFARTAGVGESLYFQARRAD